MDNELLFHSAYEAFYHMADSSQAFRNYCQAAFGEDFSQDGFSDLGQIKQILPHIPNDREAHVLDIGCGNGKMFGYLQKQTGAFIHGFDYSAEAIRTAKRLFPERSDFQVGCIGLQEYSEHSFDVVTAMDSLYFAPDMAALLAQISRWLKPGGVFFAGYQEGDVLPRTAIWETSLLADALERCGIAYRVQNITRETYQLLRRKRQAALRHREHLLAEGLEDWYRLLLDQTECAMVPYETYATTAARYLVAAVKSST